MLHAVGKLDRSRAVIDNSHVWALKGGPKFDPSPVDRAQTGSNHHVLTDGHGAPPTGGNSNHVAQLPLSLNRSRRYASESVGSAAEPTACTPTGATTTTVPAALPCQRRHA